MGKVPQKKRQALVQQFQKDPDCRLFLTTNAGSTGLNLQAADTVINVDLPWNPAVLEQRIARAHRMGQKRPVHVFVMVTEGTIEESLLTTLSAKAELATAALDVDSDINEVNLMSSVEDIRQRLEILLGAKPEGPLDESVKQQRQHEAEVLQRREKISEAGGEMLSAAFNFLGEMLPQPEGTNGSDQLAKDLRSRFSECMERDETGKAKTNRDVA